MSPLVIVTEPADGVFPALGGTRLAGVISFDADVPAGFTGERLLI